MTELTIKLTGMANGGLALGRDKGGRAIFVPFAIPGETVRVRVEREGGRFAHATLLEVVEPSAERVTPRCRHFGVCGNCHFQHMRYEAQLRAKQDVVDDQLTRVGGLKNPAVRPIRPYPEPYGFQQGTALFPSDEGGLGYWSPVERRIFRVEECPILRPPLEATLTDLDIDLPDLRKLALRLGDEDDLLAALEVEDVEPPELAVDFPISVAIVLPDRTAASLIGDPFIVHHVKGRPFRVSPGVPFPPSSAAAEMLVDAVLELLAPEPGQTVLEAPGGSGWLTAFLAERAAEVVAIEPNPDAVADAAENLDAFDTVSIYEGAEDDLLPGLDVAPDAVVLHAGVMRPEEGLPAGAFAFLERLRPRHPVVIVSEVGALAKDAKRLSKLGYRPVAFQPLDLAPQAYRVDVVSLWRK